MSNLNKPKCATEDGNVGSCDCALAIETLSGFILAPTSFRLSAANMASDATVKTALIAATKAARTGRIYPIAVVGTPTDNSQDPTSETLPNGQIVIVREGFYDATMQATDNSIYLANQLRKFNKRKMGVFMYDQNGTLWGLSIGGELAPVPLELVFTDYKLPSATNIAQTLTRLVWDKNLFLSGYGFYELSPSDYLEVTGLKSIELGFISRTTTNVLATAQILGCGDALGDEYPDEVLELDNWVSVKVSDGTSNAVTAVAYNSTTKQLTLTLTTGVASIISLAPIATLEANGIEGFEGSNSITTT